MPTQIKSEPMVSVRGVSKTFKLHHETSVKERVIALFKGRNQSNKFVALNNVNLEIRPGETVGLVGHNGSGKSTLLKVIGGIISPSGGEVWRRGKLAALLELGAGFHPDLTGRENVFLNASILGMSRAETTEMMDSIIAFSDLSEEFIDTQVKFYSSGMYVRLAFAVAVHSDPDVLLIDEVLAVGDEPFQHKCLAKIQEFQSLGKTIIFVSHSAQQIAEVCDRVVVLKSGEIVFDGNVHDGIDELHRGYAMGEVGSDSQIEVAKQDKGLCEIKSLSFTGSRGINIRRGQDLEIHVNIEKLKPGRCAITVDVLGPQREVLFRTTSDAENASVPTAPGNYDFHLRIHDTNFGVPAISMRAIVTDAAGTWIDSAEAAQRLNIQGLKPNTGTYQFKTTSSISIAE